jgi:hypothetical protein
MIRPSTFLPAGLAALVVVASAASGALAQNKPAAKPAAPAAAPAAPAGPVLVASFGDWGAYASETPRGRVCYALSKPKERLPKELKRDDGFLFVSSRPGENVRNEISIILGYPTKDNSAGELTIGSTKYALVTKGSSAWLKNAAEDPAVVEAMKRGQSLTVRANSARGNATTDRYNLAGLAQALERLKKDCP